MEITLNCFMGLTEQLSNPGVAPLLERLSQALASLEPNIASHKIVPRKLRIAQGEVLRAIVRVVASYPDGLQTFEVRRLVETELGRKVPSSTIKSDLADNPAFERIRRGRYRLR
jgi:hypothetical protein